VPASAWLRLFNGILPAYLLDDEYVILAVNEAFRCMAGDEWGCAPGASAFAVVDRFDNAADVRARAAVVFAPGRAPQSDHELCIFRTRRYGLIHAQKFATRIPSGGEAVWIVQFNILSADRLDALFSDMTAASERG
jgi:hypothetical protein